MAEQNNLRRALIAYSGGGEIKSARVLIDKPVEKLVFDNTFESFNVDKEDPEATLIIRVSSILAVQDEGPIKDVIHNLSE